MRTYKKGISLIVLVITILVLAILATTVIVSLSNTNIITEANEAVIKTRFQSMQQQLALYIADQYATTNGTFKLADLDAEAKSSTIDTIFPELKDTEYYDYVSLVDGNIVLASGMPDKNIALEVIVEQEDPEEPEVITNYTQAEIDASNYKIWAVGATNALDVVGVFSADWTTLTITKNGANSDGKIKDSAYYSAGSDISGSTLIIEKGITQIGNYAFNSALIVTVYIPKGVTYIGEVAFQYCENLSHIYYSGTKAEWNQINFGSGWDDETGNYTIHCTDGDIQKAS